MPTTTTSARRLVTAYWIIFFCEQQKQQGPFSRLKAIASLFNQTWPYHPISWFHTKLLFIWSETTVNKMLQSPLLRSLSAFPQRRLAHTVRVIAVKDIPQKAQVGQITAVKAGYARNYLIPEKYAVYATPDNMKKYNISDEPEQQKAQKIKDPEKQAAELLQYYLRNKVVKIWRHVDPVTESIAPGLVNARNVKSKLSKQLKIDLEPHEKIHLMDTPSNELPQDSAFGPVEEACKTEIRQLGSYWARITLEGGHAVYLRTLVLKR